MWLVESSFQVLELHSRAFYGMPEDKAVWQQMQEVLHAALEQLLRPISQHLDNLTPQQKVGEGTWHTTSTFFMTHIVFEFNSFINLDSMCTG